MDMVPVYTKEIKRCVHVYGERIEQATEKEACAQRGYTIKITEKYMKQNVKMPEKVNKGLKSRE